MRQFYTSLMIPSSQVSENSSWVQLLKPGSWEHSEYGPLKFTSARFDHFIKNFNDNVRKIDLAIDTEHEPEKGACGWIKKLENRGKEGLWALVDWTSKGWELVKDKIFRYLSVEFDDSWTDPESGKEFKDVLFGAALTNRPFIKGMAPVNLSELLKEPDTQNLLKFAEKIKKLSMETSQMKKFKCAKCGHIWDSESAEACPQCGATEVQESAEDSGETGLTEEGEDAEIQQNGQKADQDTGREDQIENKNAEEGSTKASEKAKKPLRLRLCSDDKKKAKPGTNQNKNKIKYFQDEDGNLYAFDEGAEDSAAGGSDTQEDPTTQELGEEGSTKGDSSLSESGPMVAFKKLSERETQTNKALSGAKGETKKILSENLRFLAESRAKAEIMQIDAMLNKHFKAGKLSVAERDTWRTILCSETPQTHVAVFSLGEKNGEKQFASLSAIIDKVLSERPAVVELKELANNRDAVQKTKEEREMTEAQTVAARVAKKHNAGQEAKRKYDEKSAKELSDSGR